MAKVVIKSRGDPEGGGHSPKWNLLNISIAVMAVVVAILGIVVPIYLSQTGDLSKKFDEISGRLVILEKTQREEKP